MSEITTIHIDGGCQPNPGHGACAFVLERPGQEPIEGGLDLGENCTCNVAEYKALINALDLAEKLNCRRLIVYTDSKLVHHQMNGHWRVLEAGLVPLHQQASRLRKAFESVAIRWIPREENARADALCRAILDNGEGHEGRPLSFGNESLPSDDKP